jgi:hypothetical protein
MWGVTASNVAGTLCLFLDLFHQTSHPWVNHLVFPLYDARQDEDVVLRWLFVQLLHDDICARPLQVGGVSIHIHVFSLQVWARIEPLRSAGDGGKPVSISGLL